MNVPTAFVLLVIGMLALVALGVWVVAHEAPVQRRPAPRPVYEATLADVDPEVAATVARYLGTRLDSPMCNVHDITVADADGALRGRWTIRGNPEARHQKPEPPLRYGFKRRW